MLHNHFECLKHNHDMSKNCNFGIFDKMDVLQHNVAGAQSYYVIIRQRDILKIINANMFGAQRNYHGCSDIVCALTMFALSQNFRVVVLEHKHDMSIYGNYFQKTTLYTVRLQLYKSCTMMFASFILCNLVGGCNAVSIVNIYKISTSTLCR